MDEVYEITYDGTPAGKAQMEKIGLYYHFSCRCRLPDDGLYRVHVICGNSRIDLGICVPLDGMFGTDKRIPVKQFGQDELSFEMVARDWKPQVPVSDPPIQEPVETAAETPNEEKPNLPEETKVPELLEPQFVPVSEKEPFEYLDRLEDAVLEVREDEVGILLCDKK